MGYDLDAIDVDLLNILQQDNQLTANELSQRLPLSISAASRRLNRLRQSGLIERESATLSDSFMKSRVFGVVSVQMKQHTAEMVSRFKAQLVDLPQVMVLLEITGTFDILMMIVERDLAAFIAFTDKVLAESEYVQRFETSFVKNRIKSTLAVPVDARDAAG